MTKKKRLLFIGCGSFGEKGLLGLLNAKFANPVEIVGVLTHTFNGHINPVSQLAKTLKIAVLNLSPGEAIDAEVLHQDPLVITIHKIDNHFDTGDVIKKSQPIPIAGMPFDLVYNLAAHIATPLMIEVIDESLRGTSSQHVQDG